MFYFSALPFSELLKCLVSETYLTKNANVCVKTDVFNLQATSRLLVNYAEPYRSQILDYLFKVCFL